MKKFLLLSAALTSAMASFAVEPEDWGGVGVLPNCYSHKISHDGSQIVGEDENGNTFYYNRTTGEAYSYAGCSFGQGYVFTDNGWVVGSIEVDLENQSNTAVIMHEGELTYPPVFRNSVTSNIHSITPDGTRLCGVINTGSGPSNRPFYCDVDANGTVGEIHYLPTPEKDVFGNVPQFCTATWISSDGKTIAGQVIDNLGYFPYPIIYQENEQGVWSNSFPAASLFNMSGLEMPAPVGEFEDEFPDLIIPEPTNFMDPDKLDAWEEALYQWSINNYDEELDPYLHLDQFMTTDQMMEYSEAEQIYEICFELYQNMWNAYWDTLFEIVDNSIFFYRNAMAMSPDGKWLASSGIVTVGENDYDAVDYLIPYLFNLQSGENWNIGIPEFNLVTNQVFPSGDVLCATPAYEALPARSYIYQRSTNEMQSLYSYVKDVNAEYGEWMEEYLTGNVQVGDTDFESAMITGRAAASDDLTVITSGVLGSAIGYNDLMEFTYILTGLPTGIEEIEVAPTADGVYRVYNLQGMKLLETKDKADFNGLAKGLYIINGKKVVL